MEPASAEMRRAGSDRPWPERLIRKEDYSPKGFRWLRLKRLTYRDRAGRQRQWESAERGTRGSSGVDAIAIYAVCTSRSSSSAKVVLVSQYRPPVDAHVLELPAGLVDAGESAGEAALRELAEETGLMGSLVKEHPVVCSDPGMSNANMRVVEVSVDMDDTSNASPKQNLDEGEDIRVHMVDASRFREQIEAMAAREGFAIDARLWGMAFGAGGAEASGGPGSDSAQGGGVGAPSPRRRRSSGSASATDWRAAPSFGLAALSLIAGVGITAAVNAMGRAPRRPSR